MLQARLVKQSGLAFWTLPSWERLGYRVAFFQRMGGVSQPPFRGLNLGLTTEDDKGHVCMNRTRALAAAEFGPLTPVLGQQVHGNRIQVVEAPASGRGWLDSTTSFPETDALITATKGLPIGVATADCLPVLLITEGPVRIAAAIHAGWRGIALAILSQAVEQICQQWSILPEHFQAAVGPGIGPDRFCIQGETLTMLQSQYPEAVVPEQRFLPIAGFDLWKAAAIQLTRAGVHPSKVSVIRECTAGNPEQYFSYRRDGKQTGRMLNMIQIKEYQETA